MRIIMKKILSLLLLLSTVRWLNGMDEKPAATCPVDKNLQLGCCSKPKSEPESVESQGWRMFARWVQENPYVTQDLARYWLTRVPWISKRQFIMHNTCFPKEMRQAIWHQICQLRLRNPNTNDLRVQVNLLRNLLKNPAQFASMVKEFEAPCGLILIHGSTHDERVRLAHSIAQDTGVVSSPFPFQADSITMRMMPSYHTIKPVHQQDLYNRKGVIASLLSVMFESKKFQPSMLMIWDIEGYCPLVPKSVDEVNATIDILDVLDCRTKLNEVVCATTTQPLCTLSPELLRRTCCVLSLHGFEKPQV